MGLRVGVVSVKPGGDSGGAWTFAAMLRESLENYEGPHVFIDMEDLAPPPPPPPPDPMGLLQEIPGVGELAYLTHDGYPDEPLIYVESPKETAAEPVAPPTGLRGFFRRLGLWRDKAPPEDLPEEPLEESWGAQALSEPWSDQMLPDPPPQPEPEPDTLETRIRRGNLDILWFTHPGGEPVSIPYIATVWDLEHRKQPYFPEVSTTGWRWADRETHYTRLLPRAAMVVTGTRAGKDEIARYYAVNPANVVVLPFPAPRHVPAAQSGGNAVSDIRSKYGIQTDFLFYPAQFWPHKNHVNLLHALKLLREARGLDLTLVLSGADKGNLAHVMQVVSDLGLHDHVIVPGFIDRADLHALYESASMLVYPSYFGPDNLPPLEGFAVGCPVAAADIDGAADYLDGAALLFDPSNPADIADKIALLHTSPDLRRKLIAKGREVAEQRTSRSYVETLSVALDKFEMFRRCWGRDYQHT